LQLGGAARLRDAAAQIVAGGAGAAGALRLGSRRGGAGAGRHAAARAHRRGRIAGVKLSADSDAVLGAATREHIATLEHGFAERATCAIGDGGPDRGAHMDFDVVLAGGGLSLVYAAYLARRGLRVAVFDKRRIGCGHREWNISRAELQPFVDAELFSADEVDALVLAEYDH